MPAYTMPPQRTESPVQARKPEISEKPAFLMQQQPQQTLQQRRISPVRSPSPAFNHIQQQQQGQHQGQQQGQQQQQQQTQPSRPNPSRWNTPASPVPTQAETPKPLTVFNNVSIAKPNPTAPVQSSPHSPSHTMNGRVASHEAPTQPKATPQKPTHVGTLYIPPVEPQDMYSNKQNVAVDQQTPNWMQSRHAPGQEVPEWLNQVDRGFPFAPTMPQQPQNMQQMYQDVVKQQQQQPPRVVYQQQQPQIQQQRPAQTMQFTTNSTSSQEQTTTSHRERIIPIQLEQTPTPTKCPTSPGFGPQPYYNMGQQQYSSVQSPGGTVYANNSPSKWKGVDRSRGW